MGKSEIKFWQKFKNFILKSRPRLYLLGRKLACRGSVWFRKDGDKSSTFRFFQESDLIPAHIINIPNVFIIQFCHQQYVKHIFHQYYFNRLNKLSKHWYLQSISDGSSIKAFIKKKFAKFTKNIIKIHFLGNLQNAKFLPINERIRRGKSYHLCMKSFLFSFKRFISSIIHVINFELGELTHENL